MRFSEPVAFTYNPMEYAAEPFAQYVTRFGNTPKRVLFLGMNPGPWGMAQTGVPFGEVTAVREWMGISGAVDRPVNEHPKRQIDGFACTRSEVSGRRLWGLMERRFGSAAGFFEHHFVVNYCPLIFLESNGRNRTPDRLKTEERRILFEKCDRFLLSTIQLFSPTWLVGVGKFAEKKLANVIQTTGIEPERVVSILHPSPANPKANTGWSEHATETLVRLKIWK